MTWIKFWGTFQKRILDFELTFAKVDQRSLLCFNLEISIHQFILI